MNDKLRVLVVDDEAISRETTAQQLEEAGYWARAAESASAALALMDQHRVDVVLSDVRMPGTDGLALLDLIKQRVPKVEVLLMTAYGSVETAVAAMQAGAADYITKPFRFPELEVRLRRIAKYQASSQELTRMRALLSDANPGGIIGRSPVMRKACERVQLFARHGAPVLITGETGTGKEVFARAIHSLGTRSRAPFAAVGCGAIPADLAESELFGHEKGAFTGAVQRRAGCFERASGGTLLLDDVDDLPLDIQAKLLRVLQEGSFLRVGGEKPVAVDVRVIATTKVDLALSVQDQKFRDDLYYRLRGLEIHLPPLRERGDDVLLLAQHFLAVLAAREKTTRKSLSAEAAASLKDQVWPGNVRELSRVMESATVLCPGELIGVEHLPDPTASLRPASPLTLRLEGIDHVDLPSLVRELEEAAIKWAMTRAHGQQTRAAELLGLPRTSLQTRLGRKRREDV